MLQKIKETNYETVKYFKYIITMNHNLIFMIYIWYNNEITSEKDWQNLTKFNNFRFTERLFKYKKFNILIIYLILDFYCVEY